MKLIYQHSYSLQELELNRLSIHQKHKAQLARQRKLHPHPLSKRTFNFGLQKSRSVVESAKRQQKRAAKVSHKHLSVSVTDAIWCLYICSISTKGRILFVLYLGSAVTTSTEASLSGRTGCHPRYVRTVVYCIVMITGLLQISLGSRWSLILAVYHNRNTQRHCRRVLRRKRYVYMTHVFDNCTRL